MFTKIRTSCGSERYAVAEPAAFSLVWGAPMEAATAAVPAANTATSPAHLAESTCESPPIPATAARAAAAPPIQRSTRRHRFAYWNCVSEAYVADSSMRSASLRITSLIDITLLYRLILGKQPG